MKFDPRFPNLTIVDHPLVQHKLTLMRDKRTSTKDFRGLLQEIAMLMGYELTRDFPLGTARIETPIASCDAPVMEGKKCVIVPVLRAGLGMTDGCGITWIILPQALRLSLPGWANEFSILLKDSAVCYVLGTQEIMARATFVAQRTHEHLALFALAGLIYFILTLVVLKLLRALENRVHIPGYSTGGTIGMGAAG